MKVDYCLTVWIVLSKVTHQLISSHVAFGVNSRLTETESPKPGSNSLSQTVSQFEHTMDSLVCRAVDYSYLVGINILLPVFLGDSGAPRVAPTPRRAPVRQSCPPSLSPPPSAPPPADRPRPSPRLAPSRHARAPHPSPERSRIHRSEASPARPSVTREESALKRRSSDIKTSLSSAPPLVCVVLVAAGSLGPPRRVHHQGCLRG